MVEKVGTTIGTDPHLPAGRQWSQRVDRRLVYLIDVRGLSHLISLQLVGMSPGGSLGVVINVIVLSIGSQPPFPSHGKIALHGRGFGALVENASLLVKVRPLGARLEQRSRN